jgi:hypothetical protein
LSELVLTIDVEYLRELFTPRGDCFHVHLSGCTSINYFDWASESHTQNLIEIEEKELEILSVQQKENKACITCTTGELSISFERLHIRLDTGECITKSQLQEKVQRYWKNWEEQNVETK